MIECFVIKIIIKYIQLNLDKSNINYFDFYVGIYNQLINEVNRLVHADIFITNFVFFFSFHSNNSTFGIVSYDLKVLEVLKNRKIRRIWYYKISLSRFFFLKPR